MFSVPVVHSMIDSISRCLPLKSNGQIQVAGCRCKREESKLFQQCKSVISTDKMNTKAWNDCDFYMGPITIEEMRKAAKVLREKRAQGELNSYIPTPPRMNDAKKCAPSQNKDVPSAELQTAEETLEKSDKVKKVSNTEEVICQEQEKTVDAAESVHEEIILSDSSSEYELPFNKPEETSDVEHVIQEAEKLIIQEFSFEEASFSGCNLSALNLSFGSNCTDTTDPLQVEVPTCDQPKDNTKESEVSEIPHTGLFTLAYISDLAEKLEVTSLTPKSNPRTPKIKNYFTTPSQAQNLSLSHMYSPISPADMSGQYLDAVDDSITEVKNDGKTEATEVIDAIVSLQNKMHNSVENESDQLEHDSITNSEVSAEKSAFVSAVMQDVEDISLLADRNPCLKVNSISKEVVEKSSFMSAVMHQEEEIEISDEVEQVLQDNSEKDVSLLQENSLCNEENFQDISQISLQSSASDTSHQKSNVSLLNDTIDEMDMILSMGVSYLETGKESTSHIEATSSATKASDRPDEILHVSKDTGSLSTFFPTPEFKKFNNASGALTLSDANKPNEDQLNVPSGTKISPMQHGRGYYAQSHGKKLFNTPIGLKTPRVIKPSLDIRSKTDAAKSQANSPFRAPKTTESRNFKHPLFGIPVPTRSLRKDIKSPVSQYIKGPVMAPRFAVVRPRSPIPTPRSTGKQQTHMRSPQQNKTETENINPNVAAISLPCVDYDSTSSIKVVEHLENKQKRLPSNIKKLMPSPGSVLRHTGRVNIPERFDGRQEVSMLVSHDAIN